MIKIPKYKNDKATFHECRASKRLLNDIFKFLEGLCLPCLTRKAVPQCCAAKGIGQKYGARLGEIWTNNRPKLGSPRKSL